MQTHLDNVIIAKECLTKTFVKLNNYVPNRSSVTLEGAEIAWIKECGPPSLRSSLSGAAQPDS